MDRLAGSLLAALVNHGRAPPGGAVSQADAGAGEYRLPAEIRPCWRQVCRTSSLQNLPGPSVSMSSTGTGSGLFADTAGCSRRSADRAQRRPTARPTASPRTNGMSRRRPAMLPDLDRLVRGLDRLARRGSVAARLAAPAPNVRQAGRAGPAPPDACVRPPRRRHDRDGHRGARPGPAGPAPRPRGRTFAKSGLSVHSAHIATYAGQTLDTFYLTEFGEPR